MQMLARFFSLMNGSFKVGNFDSGEENSTDGFARYRAFGW